MKKRLTALFLGFCLGLSLAAPCLAAEPAASEAPPEMPIAEAGKAANPPDHVLPALPGGDTWKQYPISTGGYILFDRNERTIMAVSSGLTSVTIPSSFEGVPVKYIGSMTFLNSKGTLSSVTLPDTVEIIYGGAFQQCSKLTEIKLPDSLKYIEDGAFENCTGLRTVSLGKNTTYLGPRAFSGCTNLQQVTNTGSLTFIGSYAFKECSSLTAMDLGSNSPFYGLSESAFWNCTALQSFRFPEGLTEIEPFVFYGCSSLGSDGRGAPIPLRIPEGVTAIGAGAFANCEKLVHLALPGGITSIGASAFAGCTRWEQDTAFLSAVTTLGKFAFQNCRGLSGPLSFPQSYTRFKEIPESAFENCSGLTGPLVIPDSVQKIGASAFAGCTGLSGLLRIPYQVQYGPSALGENALKDCNGLDTVFYANTPHQYSNLCACPGNEILSQIRANGRVYYNNQHPPYILSRSGGVTTISLGTLDDVYMRHKEISGYGGKLYIAAAAWNSSGRTTGVDIQPFTLDRNTDITATFHANLQSGDLLYLISYYGYRPLEAPVPIL